MITSIFGPAIVVLLFLIIFFLVCREVICWYWKINKALLLLEEIAKNTRKNTTEHEQAVRSINNNIGI